MLRAADFRLALKSRPCARSAHFAVHHVPADGAGHPAVAAHPVNLSTEGAPSLGEPVDDSHQAAPGSVRLNPAVQLGLVISKRNARRSVTRNLVRRQVRAAFLHPNAQGFLAPGAWVVRLRNPLDPARFVSARSEHLRCLLRQELTELVGRLAGSSARDRVPERSGA